MTSHITLDGRPYSIRPESYRQVVANPMAAKTSQGSSKYDDQQDWDYFVQEDWSGGIGKNTIDLTGQWFSVGDSRFQNQFSTVAPIVDLAGSLEVSQDAGIVAKFLRETHSVGLNREYGDTATGGYTKVAAVASFAIEDTDLYIVHLKVLTPSADVTVTASLYAWSGTAPTGSALDSDTFTIRADNLPGFQNVNVAFDWPAGANTGNGCVVLTTTSKFTLFTGSTFFGTETHSRWSEYDSVGTSWGTRDNPPSFRVTSFADSPNLENVLFVRDSYSYSYQTTFEGNLSYAYNTDYWDTTSGSTISTGASDPCTDAIERGRKIYLAYGANNVVIQYEAPTATPLTFYADKIDIGGGYFWRSYSNSIYYSADLTTWTEVGVDEAPLDIRFYGDFLYYITSTGLHRIGYGDAPLSSALMPLGSSSFMHVWQNRLYIANDGRLLEFDESSLRNISPLTSDGGLPEYATGNITAMTSSNLFLFACVSATYTTGRSGIYAYNGQGWSCLYLFGDDRDIYSARAINANSATAGTAIYFEVLSDFGYAAALWPDVPTLAKDVWTAQSVDYTYQYGTNSSWLETPWLYGGLVMLAKDWESIFISYDLPGVQENQSWTTSVYWKEDESDSWSLLGSADFLDAGGTSEFRWSDLPTRPASAKIKIGILHQPTLDSAMITNGFQNSKLSQNVLLAALRVKYHAMVEDRWQWSFTVPVSEDQELVDGTLQTYTFAQQIAHMDSLIVNKTPPFIFQDVTGTQYEVKVLAGNKTLEHYRGPSDYKYNYNLTLTMVTTSAYTPPA